VQGKLLTAASTKALLNALGGVNIAPGRLRAGFASDVTLAHVPGTLAGGSGTNIATNDAGVANVNGRMIIVVAMMEGAHGNDASRDAVLASLAKLATQATSANP
jgi:hypothetical protein